MIVSIYFGTPTLPERGKEPYYTFHSPKIVIFSTLRCSALIFFA